MTTMMVDMSASLKGKTGSEFDKRFLQEIIIHHQGAVDMVNMASTASKWPKLIKLAQDIITTQTGEIAIMRT